MKIIGVTGSLGTGKTTVCGILKKLGAVVLDADMIAHEAISRRGEAYKRIVKIFGRGVLNKGKEIDRRQLGGIVFNDRNALKRLCAVIHPVVIRKIRNRIKQITTESPDAVVVLDVPLLVESGMLDMVDNLVVVKSGRMQQIRRCQKSTGLGRGAILARIRSQMPITEKIRFADFVIDNSGELKQTKRKVKSVWEQIQQQAVRRKRI